ncbi:MAG: hypothetical protein WC695_10530 [Candidatus Omnitrophota bacterium]
MKRKKMPTTRVLDLAAIAVFAAGLVLCGHTLFYEFTGIKSVGTAILILVISVALAAVIRMIGIMGEFLYTITGSLFALNHAVVSLSDDVLRKELSELKHNIEKISSDTKDVTVSIDDINVFFQKIERHLDLKR